MASLDGGINPNNPCSLPMGVKVATGISGIALGVSTVVMTVFLVIFPHMGTIGIAALTTSEGVAFIAFAASLYFLNKKQDERLNLFQQQLGPRNPEIVEITRINDVRPESESDQEVNPNTFGIPQEVLDELAVVSQSLQTTNSQEDLPPLQNPNQVNNPPPSSEVQNYDDLPPLIELSQSQSNIPPLFDHGLQECQDQDPLSPFTNLDPEDIDINETEVIESEEEENMPLNLGSVVVEEESVEERSSKGKDEKLEEREQLPPPDNNKVNMSISEEEDFHVVDTLNIPQEEIKVNPFFKDFYERLWNADPLLISFSSFFPKDKMTSFSCNEKGEFTVKFEKAMIGKLETTDKNLKNCCISLAKEVSGKIVSCSKGYFGKTGGKIEFSSGANIKIIGKIEVTKPFAFSINPTKDLTLQGLIISSESTFCIDIKLIPNKVTTKPIEDLQKLKPQWN